MAVRVNEVLINKVKKMRFIIRGSIVYFSIWFKLSSLFFWSMQQQLQSTNGQCVQRCGNAHV